MRVVVLPTSAEVGEAAAAEIAAVVTERPDAVLGLATGDSPLGAYAALGRRVERDGLDLSRARGFALDEYVGLDPSDPQSYNAVIDRTVTTPLRMRAGAVRVPAGAAADLDAAADAYERAIEESGVDIQILGIGANGHIGFNEPGSAFTTRTRVVALSERTRLDNARFFATPSDVPTHALTQGLATIMRARRIVLVALGERKAEAVRAAVEGRPSAACPASVLQDHPDALLVVDEAAASRIAVSSSAVNRFPRLLARR
ncbi:glucosamine-6-phosphate deaminase [Leifsonia shinshuensis]|uniref:Glucosamine-6-phosphate deaminase n=1 Tax=Leifsonia shinshuensis TaxID=150026 RepID=A0A7G6YB48_9MICO|nr:glucosamine-6-phosphate deaminase [Leifsonia shinshuensis]QNE35713.1 glucosamine-6-phosphate deaminase [Leifsonia shinshuensis]